MAKFQAIYPEPPANNPPMPVIDKSSSKFKNNRFSNDVLKVIKRKYEEMDKKPKPSSKLDMLDFMKEVGLDSGDRDLDLQRVRRVKNVIYRIQAPNDVQRKRVKNNRTVPVKKKSH